MGMFFYVEVEPGDKCPYCGEAIKEWQSKSSNEHDKYGGCCDRHPEPLPLLRKDEVENFYQICTNPECKKWIEYEVVPLHYELVDTNS
jgi:ssDNA-binding Zn-finger/Zn-ribbon topoisomerase 1